ncbi:MAG TPA: glycosyltransferase [Flavobacterium sp.]|jgi:cellulose synthase/poly-beta-1,6-N-acetylglucosamine synthase-like glycosyltransferase
MEAVLILLLIYSLIYSTFILVLIFGFRKVRYFESTMASPETTFSIIVPFRDEVQNLPRLLQSLSQLDYPDEKWELIFVDDFSQDLSANLVNKWRLQNGKLQTTVLDNLRLTASPKKDAITRAIPIIQNQWIITTDADCKVPANWLRTLNSFIVSNEVEMIAAPICYDGSSSFRHHFERLDMMSLQGATIGGFGIGKPFMCNGANFAYTKRLFAELRGFNGNDGIASGDDVFLLQKAAAADVKKIGYLKSADAIVSTQPSENWLQLIHQRVRWAAKSTSYESYFAADLALAVFLGNLVIVVAVFLAAFHIVKWEFVAGLFLLKCIPDFTLLIQANTFLRNGRFFFPLFSALLYPFFCVLVGCFAMFGSYRWKGRKYTA